MQKEKYCICFEVHLLPFTKSEKKSILSCFIYLVNSSECFTNLQCIPKVNSEFGYFDNYIHMLLLVGWKFVKQDSRSYDFSHRIIFKC